MQYQTSYTRGLIRMQEKSTATLRRRRTWLLRQLPPLDAVLRGSLIERYKRCGKPTCKCAQGLGHGPKYYLSVSRSNERPAMDYVPQAEHARVVQYLGNYRHIREILEELCAINRELLRRREAF
ncbi:MAG: DUF6788 family protein [Gammaproteobacteria bacterium]